MAFRAIEDLPVWQAARDLAVRIFDLTARGSLGPHAGLRDQLERAAVSISNNIAEGYERGTMSELLTFLYYARGSAGEVRSMFAILRQGAEWSKIRDETEQLLHLTLSVSRQLGAWIESLKNSETKGQRYQNEETRQHRERATRRDAFLAELDRIQAAARMQTASVSIEDLAPGRPDGDQASRNP